MCLNLIDKYLKEFKKSNTSNSFFNGTWDEKPYPYNRYGEEPYEEDYYEEEQPLPFN